MNTTRTFKATALGSALAILALATAPQAEAADAAMIKAAKKEGQAVWYTTLIVSQMVRPAVAAFEKKYGVKVKYARANSSTTAIKILNEHKAGRVQADLTDGTSTPGALIKEGIIDAWLPDGVKNYPSYMVDKGKRWTTTNIYVLTPAYNTNLIKPGTQPKTYEELLNPKYKGKITWNGGPSTSGSAGFVGTILGAMGEKKGMDYLKKLAKQNIAAQSASARKVLDTVIAGEYSICLQCFNHHSVISQKKGAPVNWYAIEPATVVLHLVAKIKNSPNPNAGKLLFDFLVSDEGQAIFQKAGYLPANPKFPAKTANLKPEGGGFQAQYLDPGFIDKNTPRWLKIYSDLFR
jgi:iron(III) transport system substrate-binding protein